MSLRGNPPVSAMTAREKLGLRETRSAATRSTALRIVAWNIRAGGGGRVGAIARQLARWAPDVVALSEFRATAPSLALAPRQGGGTHPGVRRRP